MPTADMGTPGSGRRRNQARTYSAEDQALNQIAREAEARLAAKRAARAEARDIRMKELEKQQKEAEEKQDRHFELLSSHTTTNRMISSVSSNSYSGSRRGSDDSTEGSREDQRELKKEIAELEEKYKKAMMNNAQLDNEKQSYVYQVDLMKDSIEELEETMTEVQRECRDRNRELEMQKRQFKDLQRDFEFVREALTQRDKLIQEHGLVLVGGELEEPSEEVKRVPAALVSPNVASLLEQVTGSSLDDKIKTLVTEKEESLETIKKLKQELENQRERSSLSEKYSPDKSSLMNGPDVHLIEMQREANRQVADYKMKLQQSEANITTLEGNIIRLEGQVKRYKQAAENAEKIEDELKQEKRKLQRELREAQNTIEELQNQNGHLSKRLDKIKSARNALVRP